MQTVRNLSNFRDLENTIAHVRQFCEVAFTPSRRHELYELLSGNITTDLGIGPEKVIDFLNEFNLRFPQARLLDSQFVCRETNDTSILVRLEWSYVPRHKPKNGWWQNFIRTPVERIKGRWEYLQFEVRDNQIVEIVNA